MPLTVMAARPKTRPHIAVVVRRITMLGNAVEALQMTMPCITKVAQQKTTSPIVVVAQQTTTLTATLVED